MDYLLSREKTSIKSSNHLRARSVLMNYCCTDSLFIQKLLANGQDSVLNTLTFDLHYPVFNKRDAHKGVSLFKKWINKVV